MIFSKLQGCYWPNIDLVADKCANVADNVNKEMDCSAFLAGMSPTKDGNSVPSIMKSRRGNPAAKGRPNT